MAHWKTRTFVIIIIGLFVLAALLTAGWWATVGPGAHGIRAGGSW